MEAEPGDVLLFVADTWEVTCKALYGLRKRLGAELKLYDPRRCTSPGSSSFRCLNRRGRRNAGARCTIPSRRRGRRIRAAGHRSGQVPRPGLRPGDQWLRGGRRDDPDPRPQAQQKVFDLLGIDPPTARERFGFLLDALQFGAPPHGGIALGIDRVVMLFGGLDNIRDCIAFPKTQRATDLMTEAPGMVDAHQLQELGLAIEKPQD